MKTHFENIPQLREKSMLQNYVVSAEIIKLKQKLAH